MLVQIRGQLKVFLGPFKLVGCILSQDLSVLVGKVVAALWLLTTCSVVFLLTSPFWEPQVLRKPVSWLNGLVFCYSSLLAFGLWHISGEVYIIIYYFCLSALDKYRPTPAYILKVFSELSWLWAFPIEILLEQGLFRHACPLPPSAPGETVFEKSSQHTHVCHPLSHVWPPGQCFGDSIFSFKRRLKLPSPSTQRCH